MELVGRGLAFDTVLSVVRDSNNFFAADGCCCAGEGSAVYVWAGDAVYLCSLRHDEEVDKSFVGYGSGIIVAGDVSHRTGKYLDIIRVLGLQKTVAV